MGLESLDMGKTQVGGSKINYQKSAHLEDKWWGETYTLKGVNNNVTVWRTNSSKLLHIGMLSQIRMEKVENCNFCDYYADPLKTVNLWSRMILFMSVIWTCHKDLVKDPFFS